MEKGMETKGCLSEIKEITEQGTVLFYASVFGNKDLGGDVIERGAFAKTISENLKNIRHFKHHDNWKMVGVIQDIKEDSYGLLVSSKLILKTQLGAETYEEYKAMREAGKSMDHSIGYRTIKFEEENRESENYTRKLKELKLMEVSTLTAWGMNPLAQTVDVKSFETLNFDELLKEQKYFQLLLNCKFTDAKLEDIEKLKNLTESLILSRKPSTQPNEPIKVIGSELIKTANFKL
jgi:HK97 family phage prohead protease